MKRTNTQGPAGFSTTRRKLFNSTAIAACLFALSGIAPFSMLEAQAAVGKAEQTSLKFGFIKLTDMVPLAIAYEKGYFEDEGLSVTLEAQANWKVLLDRVVTGELDGAHMLAGQPIGATIGFGTKADIITAFSMDMNGNGITVSNAVWEELKKKLPMKDGMPVHPIDPKYLKAVVDDYKKQGKTFKMGMVFPVSTHNYELRYWLAAGGMNPGYYAPAKGDTSGTLKADVPLSVTPPPQMPSTMEAGTIDGYCVGLRDPLDPGERPVRLLLPALDPGLYYLQVTATLQDGTPAGAESMLIDSSVPGEAAP